MLVTSSILKQNEPKTSLLRACNKLKWAQKYEFVFETEQIYNELTIARAHECELANCELVFETERTYNELTIVRARKLFFFFFFSNIYDNIIKNMEILP